MLEKTLESPLDCKEIQSVHPKGNQSLISLRRTDAEAETPILWSPDKSWLIWKAPDAGKDWGQEEKGMTENEMVRLHHRLNGHELEQATRNDEGQESLACCSPWGCEESRFSYWTTTTTKYDIRVLVYETETESATQRINWWLQRQTQSESLGLADSNWYI